MPVDYSKWDALELSDDSDFEPHPNVDKRSFIRAKQNQIHMQRAERKNQITTLKYERVINDGLLKRIDALVSELKSHEKEAKDPNTFLYQALIASAGDPDEDEAPKPPEGVHQREQEKDGPIRFSQMMGSLADQVKKEVDESKTEGWAKAYIKGVEEHKSKVQGLQKELEKKLVELENEEGKKITSENLKEGFNSSHVSKGGPAGKKTETVEVLNPGALNRSVSGDGGQTSGADADLDIPASSLQKVKSPDDEEEPEPSELGKQFLKIKSEDYQGALKFILQNRSVLAEQETDGLLVYAFDAGLKSNLPYAKHCVHQALLLQYCRSLGPDGAQLFFKRIMTPNHQARKVFYDDVNNTFNRIKSRTAELAAERANESQQIEQIQLQAVEPGTEIHINVPSADSTEEAEKHARAIFETFPPGFQRALESGSLDKVNEVLGKMSVEEAEEVVEQLGESGMLDMRQGVIDGTTDEGLEQLRKMKEQEAKDMGRIEEVDESGPVPDPD